MAKWWEKGVRFECQGSGKCCVSRGTYGHVYLTIEDRRRFARHFRLPTATFTRKYCERQGGIWALKGFEDSCAFLKGKSCGVYEARPTQCRTWPFWPENMKPKAWDKEVASFCPGVGKGKIRPAAEIRRALRVQEKSEEGYGS